MEGISDSIQAKLVVEAANMPVTHRADEQMQQQGIVIVPDLLPTWAVCWRLITSGYRTFSHFRGIGSWC